MRMPFSSRIIYTLTAIFLALGSHLADFNDSHLYNPKWPPHAKLHDARTLGLSLLLGLMTILFAWRKTGERVSAVIAASGERLRGVFLDLVLRGRPIPGHLVQQPSGGHGGVPARDRAPIIHLFWA